MGHLNTSGLPANAPHPHPLTKHAPPLPPPHLTLDSTAAAPAVPPYT